MLDGIMFCPVRSFMGLVFNAMVAGDDILLWFTFKSVCLRPQRAPRQ
jgi:hypothetical protein